MSTDLVLTIYHGIFLSKEQRYALHQGQDVEVIGVSLPVWLMHGQSSEPAEEVFCKYYLKNPNKEVPINICNDGYIINLPYRVGNAKEIDDAHWRKLTDEQMSKYYNRQATNVTSADLLDYQDGGYQLLRYKEHDRVKDGDHILNIIHFVNIQDLSTISQSHSNTETNAIASSNGNSSA
jgi:hypothetical protein